MSAFKDKSSSSSSLHDVTVVLADDADLDAEHRNPGGAPIEDVSPIGLQVGWWTAVFLSARPLASTAVTSLDGAQISRR